MQGICASVCFPLLSSFHRISLVDIAIHVFNNDWSKGQRVRCHWQVNEYRFREISGVVNFRMRLRQWLSLITWTVQNIELSLRNARVFLRNLVLTKFANEHEMFQQNFISTASPIDWMASISACGNVKQ